METSKLEETEFDHELSARAERTASWLVESFRVNGWRGSSAWQSRFFHPIRGWGYPYPETSGYLIPTLYDYLDFRPGAASVSRAIQETVAWLLELQLPSGAFPGGHRTPNGEYYLVTSDYVRRRTRPPQASVFNSAQILRGLLRHTTETGDIRSRDAAHACAAYLAESVTADGSFTGDVYALGGSPAYFAYVAPPLLAAGQHFGEPKFGDPGVRALHRIVKSANPSDGFIADMGFRNNDVAHTHTIAYTLQGLLESSAILGPEGNGFRDTARKAVEKLFHLGEIHKRLPGGFGAAWRPVWTYSCVTGGCQVALAMLQVYDYDPDPRLLNAACRLYSNAAASQSTHGALPGSVPFWGPYMSFRWPNWTAKYFLDLILLLRKYLRSEMDRV